MMTPDNGCPPSVPPVKAYSILNPAAWAHVANVSIANPLANAHLSRRLRVSSIQASSFAPLPVTLIYFPVSKKKQRVQGVNSNPTPQPLHDGSPPSYVVP